jgi:hypothetical protein
VVVVRRAPRTPHTDAISTLGVGRDSPVTYRGRPRDKCGTAGGADSPDQARLSCELGFAYSPNGV